MVAVSRICRGASAGRPPAGMVRVHERRKRRSERGVAGPDSPCSCTCPSAVFHEGVRQMVEQKSGNYGELDAATEPAQAWTGRLPSTTPLPSVLTRDGQG